MSGEMLVSVKESIEQVFRERDELLKVDERIMRACTS